MIERATKGRTDHHQPGEVFVGLTERRRESRKAMYRNNATHFGGRSGLAGRRGHPGSALVYLTVTLVALLAFASLAVDLGRVQVARAELQVAADAAARHGAAGLETGVPTAEANAHAAAYDNKVDGSAVVLNPTTDVEFGTWDSSNKSFTPLAGAALATADAIRVTARRTAATGNAVPLLFARVIGRESCDVHAVSVARYRPDTSFHGFVGINGVTMRNNTFFGSYNSAVTTDPTEATATASGSLYSNGAITAGNGSNLKGNAVLGPAAPAVSGATVTGSTTRMSTTIAAPPQAAWTPATNPNNLPQDYTATGNVTLPGGTYWFTSLAVVGTLTFSGPATITVNGPIDVDGSLLAYQLIPENLKIYQIGANSFGDSQNGNNVDIVADISAPGADVVFKNNLKFRGRLVANSIEVKNNSELFYDAALAGGNDGSKVVTVR
jgi:Flp pilus assembly protein TadG